MKNKIIIDTPEAMADIAKRAGKLPCVGIDTEFFWETTFYPVLGIVQISFSDRDVFIIDAVALPSLPHLKDVLENKKTVKILHDARQDLSILSRITGAEPENIFDTQLAAGFAGMKSKSGLSSLLLKAIDVEIPKSETRSNWLRRPLSTSQIAYALNDVRFLSDLKVHIEKRVQELGNNDLLREELASLDNPELYQPIEPEFMFRRIKAGRLKRRDLAVLRELVIWRENRARSVDRPRGRIANDHDLIRLTRERPETKQELRAIKDLSSQLYGRYSNKVLSAIERGISVPEKECPQVEEIPRRTKSLTNKTKSTLSSIRSKCEKRGIDPALVATKAEIMLLLAAGKNPSPSDHRPLQGWRGKLLQS